MKRVLCLLLLVFVPLGAQTSDAFSQPIQHPPDTCPVASYPENPFLPPFRVEAEALGVARAKVDDKGFEGQGVKYAYYDVAASATAPVEYKGPIPDTGFTGTLGYKDLYFNWENNPFFKETNFPTWRATFAAFTTRVCGWVLYGSLGLRQQTLSLDPSHYGMWELAFGGRYRLTSRTNVYVGALVQRGYRDTFVLPIVGFDWCCAPKFKLSVVFPTDMSAKWAITKNIYIAGAIRFIRERLRVSDAEPLPRAIFEYRTYGGEAQLGYERCARMGFKLFAGTTFSGWLRLVNPTGTKLLFLHLDGAPYVGASGYVRF